MRGGRQADAGPQRQQQQPRNDAQPPGPAHAHAAASARRPATARATVHAAVPLPWLPAIAAGSAESAAGAAVGASNPW
ncbi:hypothetical protein ABTA52_19635, partial [Acinetobacter baumannii]